MLKKIAYGFGLLLLLFTVYLYVQAVRTQDALPLNSTTMQLKPCPDSPNCVSTQSTQLKKKRDPIPFTGSAEEAKQKLKRIVGNMSRTKLEKEDGNYLHYTFKTWPIPFIDDVEFIIDGENKVIDYRSASRVGKSDLGVNSARMVKVVAAFAG